ncbi:hypothetical protein [Mesobacillus harenae]|nr:hypothetical protein [Mesobacillus harenae]
MLAKPQTAKLEFANLIEIINNVAVLLNRQALLTNIAIEYRAR